MKLFNWAQLKFRVNCSWFAHYLFIIFGIKRKIGERKNNSSEKGFSHCFISLPMVIFYYGKLICHTSREKNNPPLGNWAVQTILSDFFHIAAFGNFGIYDAMDLFSHRCELRPKKSASKINYFDEILLCSKQ